MWRLLVPPMLFAAGVFQALNYWNTRSRRFGRLSVAQVTRSVTIVAVQLAAGFSGLVSGGSLMGAAFGGYLGATSMLSLLIWKNDRSILCKCLNLPGILWGMKRYRNFPLINMWSAFLNTIATEFPVLLLASFFSTAVVGSYSLGRTVLHYPMIFIGSSLSQVFFSTAASATHAGEMALARVVEETEVRLMILGILPFIILLVTGEGDLVGRHRSPVGRGRSVRADPGPLDHDHLPFHPGQLSLLGSRTAAYLVDPECHHVAGSHRRSGGRGASRGAPDSARPFLWNRSPLRCRFGSLSCRKGGGLLPANTRARPPVPALRGTGRGHDPRSQSCLRSSSGRDRRCSRTRNPSVLPDRHPARPRRAFTVRERASDLPYHDPAMVRSVAHRSTRDSVSGAPAQRRPRPVRPTGK